MMMAVQKMLPRPTRTNRILLIRGAGWALRNVSSTAQIAYSPILIFVRARAARRKPEKMAFQPLSRPFTVVESASNRQTHTMQSSSGCPGSPLKKTRTLLTEKSVNPANRKDRVRRRTDQAARTAEASQKNSPTKRNEIMSNRRPGDGVQSPLEKVVERPIERVDLVVKKMALQHRVDRGHQIAFVVPKAEAGKHQEGRRRLHRHKARRPRQAIWPRQAI